MGKKIMSSVDYALHMIDVMVKHDQNGAVPEWVDGTVRAWLVKMLKALDLMNIEADLATRISDDGKALILRAINSMHAPKSRATVKTSCILLGIMQIESITEEEAPYVKLIPMD